MEDFNPRRIALVGAGSLGGLLGGLLCEGGLDVTLIDLWKEHIDRIRKDGLRITGYGGDRVIKLEATTDAGEAGKMDVVIFQTKAHHTARAALDALPLFGEHTVAVSFTNGLGKEEIIGGVVGMHRVIGGTTMQGANVTEPGVIRHAGNLPSTIGELDGRLTDRIQKIEVAFNKAGLHTAISENIRLTIWKKAIVNIGTNPIHALCNLRVGEIFDVQEVKEIIFDTMEEAVRVGRAEGMEALDFDGPKEVLMQITGKDGTSTNRSGMLMDVLAKRKTEIDFLNGAIVRLGMKHGIPTPINKTLVAAIKGLERNFDPS